MPPVTKLGPARLTTARGVFIEMLPPQRSPAQGLAAPCSTRLPAGPPALADRPCTSTATYTRNGGQIAATAVSAPALSDRPHAENDPSLRHSHRRCPVVRGRSWRASST